MMQKRLERKVESEVGGRMEEEGENGDRESWKGIWKGKKR